jgi:predicted O-methyltransferase YrrM
MHSIINTCIDYLQFYAKSNPSSGHGIHSPFVYRFTREVLGDSTSYPDYVTWHNWRNELLSDYTLLPIVELGAGSVTAPGRSARSVADLVRRVAKPVRTGRLLYRLARYYSPEYVVELGTSLGMSTAFFSLACQGASIHTIEGNPAVAAKAQANFDRWQCGNIELTIDNFDKALPAILEGLPRVDLAFLDGHHQQEPTLRYFEQLLTKKQSQSIFIVDDIYWSPGMKSAWQAIKQHPQVRCTIDLFQFGLVFFKEEFKEARHFSIRF